MSFTKPIPRPFSGRLRSIGLLGWAFSVTLLGSPALAQDPQGNAKTAKAKKIESHGEERTLVTTINFSKSLGLPFESLITLGARIEAAIRHSDPVGLASMAKELSVCEAVSGKTANLTSATLYKEAVTLAEMRKDAAELRAVAQFVTSDDTSRELLKLAGEAEAREKERRSAAASGERTRGITGTLTVHNNTQYQINIFADGRQLGWVLPYDNYTYNVGAPSYQNTVLTAGTPDGMHIWPPSGGIVIDQIIPHYDWFLN